jgi:hypothetical protein
MFSCNSCNLLHVYENCLSKFHHGVQEPTAALNVYKHAQRAVRSEYVRQVTHSEDFLEKLIVASLVYKSQAFYKNQVYYHDPVLSHMNPSHPVAFSPLFNTAVLSFRMCLRSSAGLALRVSGPKQYQHISSQHPFYMTCPSRNFLSDPRNNIW